MLIALRRLAGTWVAKILFVLLILSFAIWGIEDVVRNLGRETAVARVGGVGIELAEVQQATRRELARLARELGPRFEADEALRRAVARVVLDRLIADRALEEEAKRLGITAPAPAVREVVFALPGLRGADGTFSRPLLENLLRHNDLTEAAFLNLIAQDLLRQQLAGAVRAGAAAPDALAAPLLAWAREQRLAEVVVIPRAAMPEPPPPTEAQLRRFQENHPTAFSTPEYRDVAIALLTPEALMAEVAVSEAALREAFVQRHSSFARPERRLLRQAVVPSEAQARALAEAWRKGAAFSTIEAEARAAGGAAADLGVLEQAALPFAELAAAAFAAPAGTITDPIASPFGWHVLQIVRILPPENPSFEELRERLQAELAREAALDLLYQRATRIETAVAAGEGLEEVARRFGLTVAVVTIDTLGRTPEATPLALPLSEAGGSELLRAIFATRPGDGPRVSESGDVFILFEVRAIRPPALRPLAEVEAMVRAAYLEQERRRAAEQRAASLLASRHAGRSLAAAAQEMGLALQRIGPFGRDPAAAAALPAELLAPLFAARRHEAVMVETRDGFAVAEVVAVVAFDPTSDPLALGRMRDDIEAAMQEELEEQYRRALRQRAGVRLNASLFEQVLGR